VLPPLTVIMMMITTLILILILILIALESRCADVWSGEGTYGTEHALTAAALALLAAPLYGEKGWGVVCDV
jgi:hypothetical protein